MTAVKVRAQGRAENLRSIVADVRSTGVTSVRKIAAELNRWGVRDHGLPWRENDVRRAVKRVGRLF